MTRLGPEVVFFDQKGTFFAHFDRLRGDYRGDLSVQLTQRGIYHQLRHHGVGYLRLRSDIRVAGAFIPSPDPGNLVRMMTQ